MQSPEEHETLQGRHCLCRGLGIMFGGWSNCIFGYEKYVKELEETLMVAKEGHRKAWEIYHANS